MLNGKNIDKWNNMKFGLVLSGGGAKGAYEAGAIKAMGEMDVIEKVYGVSGTSVGALNTLVFAMDDVALMEELWENIGLMTVAAPKVADGDSRAIKDIVGKLHITAQMQGSGDTARVSFRRELFPTRDYDTFSLPSGVYQSLRVTIGEGAGHNWWCVIFPSLCVPATADGFADAAAAGGFTDAEISLMTRANGAYVVKFRSLELLQALKKYLFGE